MSNWKELYPSVRLSPSDGFFMCSLSISGEDKRFSSILKKLGLDNEDITKLIKDKNDIISHLGSSFSMRDKLNIIVRNYLYETLKGSFAIANKTAAVHNTYDFHVAFRDEKDMFIFLMRFREAKRAPLYPKNKLFLVRIAKSDEKEFVPRGEFVSEDPHGLL